MSTLRPIDGDTPRRSTRISARLDSKRHSNQAAPSDPARLKAHTSAPRKRRKLAKGGPRGGREPPQVVPRGDILFPVEIWKLVFKYLHEDVDQRQFARAAVPFLSALRHEVESILYKTPFLAGAVSAVRFAQSISESTCLARVVEALTINVSARDNERADLYRDTLRSILDAVPRLVSIDMRGDLRRRGQPFSGSWRIPTLLEGKILPLRHIRGFPAVLDKGYAATLRVLGPQLEELRLRSKPSSLYIPAPPTLACVDLPKLHTIACDMYILRQIKDTRNVTHLWLIAVAQEAINEAVDLLGPQLVSLRIEQGFVNPQGPMYPTERLVHWDRCTRLKFLHVVDMVTYPSYRRWTPTSIEAARLKTLQLSDQPQHLPPILETFVWVPAWVRKVPPAKDEDVSMVGPPEQMHRYTLRCFAEASLKHFCSLKELFYLWSDEGYFHCVLSPEGDLFEAHAELEHMSFNAWACVPCNA